MWIVFLMIMRYIHSPMIFLLDNQFLLTSFSFCKKLLKSEIIVLI